MHRVSASVINASRRCMSIPASCCLHDAFLLKAVHSSNSSFASSVKFRTFASTATATPNGAGTVDTLSSSTYANSSADSSWMQIFIAAIAGSAAVAVVLQSNEQHVENAELPPPAATGNLPANYRARVPPPSQRSLSELTAFYSIPFESTDAVCMKSDPKDSMSFRMDALIHQMQNDIGANIEALEADEWSRQALASRPQGPALLTRRESPMGRKFTIEDGLVFEKAGVNTTVVRRDFMLEDIAAMLNYNPEGHSRLRKWYEAYTKNEKANRQVKIPLYTASISLVLQPRNPHCPTVHCNYRHFEYVVPDESSGAPRSIWWFAGGADLTPMSVDDSDSTHFHRILYRACRRHSPDYYPKFKKWADDYFDIAHRGEKRGVGGIFFDDLSSAPNATAAEDAAAKEKLFGFIGDCARAFSSSYFPLIASHRWDPYSGVDREWQLWRRSRYPEFVLTYDRGTAHGFNTVKKQRTVEEKNLMSEYILMSLPPVATWKIIRQPKNDKEKYTLQVLRNPKDWIDPKVEEQLIAKEEAQKKK